MSQKLLNLVSISAMFLAIIAGIFVARTQEMKHVPVESPEQVISSRISEELILDIARINGVQSCYLQGIVVAEKAEISVTDLKKWGDFLCGIRNSSKDQIVELIIVRKKAFNKNFNEDEYRKILNLYAAK